MKIKNATVVKCGICEAPYRKPLTEGWSATTYQLMGLTYVQIHRPGCPNGFVAKVPPDPQEEAA